MAHPAAFMIVWRKMFGEERAAEEEAARVLCAPWDDISMPDCLRDSFIHLLTVSLLAGLW